MPKLVAWIKALERNGKARATGHNRPGRDDQPQRFAPTNREENAANEPQNKSGNTNVEGKEHDGRGNARVRLGENKRRHEKSYERRETRNNRK